MASDITTPLRAAVTHRAEHRCEYCLIHEDDAGFPHRIDHILSRKHGGSSVFENLAYACVLCNRHKGSDIASINPKTGETIRLFHPPRDRWTDHFHIAYYCIEPITEVGAATVRLMQLNAADRVVERRILGSRGYPAR